MLRSRKDVDKHVQDLLKKVNNETERKLLGFNFAKHYHQIGENKLARQHLSSYLAVKDTSAPGHRLAGQISEALGDKEAAVKSWKRSFDLDNTQKDLIFKICGLLCEFPVTPNNRNLQQCWLERAEALQPQHSVVFELKQRLMLSSGGNAEGRVEEQLKTDMMAKPADMKLRIHLLKLYLDSGRVKEAYEHMIKIESLQVFSQEIEWYECAHSVLDAYGKQHKDAKNALGLDFYCHLLNTAERTAFLKVLRAGQNHKTSQVISEVVLAVHHLDATLKEVSAAASNIGLATEVILHFTSQLYFLSGLILLLKAQAGLEEEQQMLGYAATLFATSYHQQIIPAGSRSADKKLLESWIASATYRQSQCGHCIVAWETREGRKWVVDIIKKWDNPDGRRRIFDCAFSSGSTGDRPYHAEIFTFPRANAQSELPCFSDLLELDRSAAQLNCGELHPLLWLGIRYFIMHRRSDDTNFAPDLSQILVACRFVRDLPFSTPSWNSSAPETLCTLDVEALIYAAVYSWISLDETDPKGIRTVPASLTKLVSTEQQSTLWQTLVKLVTGSSKENFGELRRTLQRGLETIRLTGNHHGIPLELVAKLAKTFMTRAGRARAFPAVDVPAPIMTDVLSVEQTEALEIQAGRYWKTFLDMANSGNRFTAPISGRLFEFRPSDCDMDALIQEAKLYTGYQTWRLGRREEALRLLQSIVDPFASYYQGLLFKEMAEEELRKGATVYESRSAANILLNKSRDAFYLTLDRLRSPGMERFHPLDQKLSEVIEKVESKLGSLTNLSVANGHTTDEEESEEREFVTPQAQQTTSTPHRRNAALMSSMRNGTSVGSRLDMTARAESRPSPERLDAQLRQMVFRQEEFNQAISTELKQIRAEVVDIKTLIQKLETHLEVQAKQEYRGGARAKKSTERGSEAYDEDADDWEEGEEEEIEDDEEDEPDLDDLIPLRGKLKGSGASDKMRRGAAAGPAIPPMNLPLYAPPFAPPGTRPQAYGYPPAYGPPFHPSQYQQFGGFPGNYMAVPSPVAGFPVAPGYSNYSTGMAPLWDAAAISPAPGAFGLPAGPPIQVPQAVMPPVAAPPAAPASVFSRLGNRDPTAAATAAAPIPPNINDVDSATEALRRAAANVGSGMSAPHAYQINLPAQTTPSKSPNANMTAPLQQTPTSGLLANIPEPQYSSVSAPAGSAEKDKSLIKTPVRDRNASTCSDGSYAPEEEIDNYPDFKPIIPLPEEVEVKTGEEGEDVLFDQRCKLFRFVEGEWKERGVGQLKILRDPSTKKVRLLMRRDQVLKICANHTITSDIKLSEMKAAKNSWIWAAMDFADGEKGNLEKFAARFKTEEQSTEFRKVFEEAQATAPKTPEKKTTTVSSQQPAVQQGFGNQFAPKSGTWSCNSCYVNNKTEAVKCVSCDTPKPGAVIPTSSASSGTALKFGMPSTTASSQKPPVQQGFGNQFAPKAGTWACDVCYLNNKAEAVKCISCETPKPGAVIPASSAPTAPTMKFGMPMTSTPVGTPPKFGMPSSTSASTAPTTGFSFGSTPSSTGSVTGMKFGMPPAPTGAVTTTSSTIASASTASSGSLFGMPTAPTAAVTTTPSIFGSTATASSGSLFGLPAATPGGFSFPSTTSSAPAISTTTTKPAFSFSLPSSSMPSSTDTVVTKAPFTFSPPKLAVAPPKTNGQSEKIVTPATGASSFSSGIFGTPKDTIAPATTPVSSAVFPSTIFGTPKPTATESAKSAFGNFSFGALSTPASDADKKAEVKPSPFAGFSFQASPPKEAPEKKESGGMLFSLLAGKTPSAGFAITPNKEFPGTGTPIFTSNSKPNKEGDQDDNEEGDDGGEYEPNVAFEPVIPLPALVETSTGEEDETVLFSDRAFLYRFVPDTKEWKEKGRGDMKILEHKTTGRVRLLMRREQVLKVCCNHYITPQLSLKPLQTSDRTWTWSAQDFSEGELAQEMFALKFKTNDQAQKFKNVFEEAQRKTPTSTEPQPAEASKSAPSAASKSLAEMFKPKEGSWECQGCFLRNAADVIVCPSCEAVKPGAVAPPKPAEKAPAAASAFSFGAGFSFNSAATTPSTAPTTTGFGGFSFSLNPATTTATPVKSGRSPNVSVGSDNEYYEEEADVHFEPVIPMPEVVQVKTGEEDEEVMYCHRAKLFRFADGEWKEKGVGDVKILRHTSTGKTRLLMRREQILKICLNHALTSAITFRKKDDKSWLWAAQDFAEGEGKTETFVIRFRDADTSKAFMAAVIENQNGGSETNGDDAKVEVELVFEKEATAEQKRKAAELQLPLNFFLYESAPPCPGCRGCSPEDGGKEASVAKPASTPITATQGESSFGNVSFKPAPNSATMKADSSPFGNTSFMKTDSTVSGLSFSSLASTTTSGFNKPAAFSWSGAGKPIFGQSTVTGSPASQSEDKSANNDDEGDGDEEPESNDPHFEPIIPLPDIVEVKTGEEDEEIIFSHRAKLYRFESSTKEWKEKGVGDIKILHQREKNTYRILLRRDQIHKLACNHWLTTDMALKPLSTSTSAWTWFAMDFAQNELLSEHFAVRFKLEETARLFYNKFVECQSALKGAVPKSSTATTIVPAATQSASLSAPKEVEDPEEQEEGDEDEEGGEEEEEYEDMEETVMFEKRCTLSYLEGITTEKTWVLLGTGNIKIVYDDEMLCCRITVQDGNQQYLCDNVIAIETELKVDNKECVWSAIDYSSEESFHRTFRAQFSSTDSALEFKSIFAEGKQFAEKSDVHDEPDLNAAGYDHSNDDHGDYDEGKF